MKIKPTFFLLSILVFATGCPKYQPSVDFKNPNTLVAKINAHIADQQRLYIAALDANPAQARQIRNELIDNALPYIDGAYIDFITDLQAGRDRNNFMLDLVELGAAASVGITNGERPLQIIGVALTAFRGGRRSIDANFYKDTSVPILISKMDGNRATVRATILEREAKGADEYSLGAAVSDIVDYYNAGTLVRAFTQLQQDTAIVTEASERHLKNLKEAGVKGAPSAKELADSIANANSLRTLRKPYVDANKNVTNADAKINNAVQDMTDADTAITKADQRIGEATAQLAAASAPAAKALAQGALDKATAAKATAVAKKTVAEGEKTSAQTAKAAALTARDQAYKKLRGIYEAIVADPKLSQLLEMVPNDPSLTPARKATLQTMLQENKARPEPETDAELSAAVDGYYTILLGFAQIVAAKANDEPELNERLQKILEASK